MVPSLLGNPDAESMRTCSLFAVYPGHGLCNVFGQCTGVDIPDDPSYYGPLWDATYQHVSLRPATDAEKAEMNLGLSFLPWNKTDYVRVDTAGNILPVNPFSRQLMMANGVTIAKLAAAGTVGFFVGKFAMKKLAKQL